MKNKSFSILVLFLLLPLLLPAQLQIRLQLFASGFDTPVDIAHAGDERLFVVEKDGRIRIVDINGQVLLTPFLDIDSRVGSSANEQGLLGLTFHPRYSENGYFFVNYTNNSGNTRISRFQVDPQNPNRANSDSEVILLEVDQPFNNHNAGDLSFGPDGYLYFGLGDGGSGGDPQNLAQNRLSLLGKMLRIDVDNGDPYRIPPTNPFASDDFTLDEIWAIGLRNPWRFSFDRATGDLWIADVGQNRWEEINFQPAGSPGGQNYGWRCYEGDAAFNTTGCGTDQEYTFPVFAYAHTGGFCAGSVTGGFVYRGGAYPNLVGHYLYADFCTGKIWSLVPDSQGNWINTELLDGVLQDYSTFGEDQDGELYLAGLSSGNLYRIQDTSPTAAREAPLPLFDLRIGPNPFSRYLSLNFRVETAGIYTIQVLEPGGRPIRKIISGIQAEFSNTIDLNDLPAGIYWLVLEKDKAKLVRKVVKQ